jgi:hypothetical protein
MRCSDPSRVSKLRSRKPLRQGRTLAAALVAPGPDQSLNVGFHQQLQHRLCHSSQKISFAGLLQQLGQRQSLLGHRVLSRLAVKSRSFT